MQDYFAIAVWVKMALQLFRFLLNQELFHEGFYQDGKMTGFRI